MQIMRIKINVPFRLKLHSSPPCNYFYIFNIHFINIRRGEMQLIHILLLLFAISRLCEEWVRQISYLSTLGLFVLMVIVLTVYVRKENKINCN